jgi:hypothetical protein
MPRSRSHVLILLQTAPAALNQPRPFPVYGQSTGQYTSIDAWLEAAVDPLAAILKSAIDDLLVEGSLAEQNGVIDVAA